MSDVAKRLIELAEDRLKVAEELGLSVSGLIGQIYISVETGAFDDACTSLEAIDELINEARSVRHGAGKA